MKTQDNTDLYSTNFNLFVDPEPDPEKTGDEDDPGLNHDDEDDLSLNIENDDKIEE